MTYFWPPTVPRRSGDTVLSLALHPVRRIGYQQMECAIGLTVEGALQNAAVIVVTLKHTYCALGCKVSKNVSVSDPRSKVTIKFGKASVSVVSRT